VVVLQLWGLGEILAVKLSLLQNMNTCLGPGSILWYEISHEKWDMRFGTWSFTNLYTAGSLTAADRELVKCNLDLACMQGVRWDKADTVREGDYIFFYEKGNENYHLWTGKFLHHRILSSVKRAEIVCDMMCYIVLRGRWFNIIVLNVHTPNEEKSDNAKDNFMRKYSRFSIIWLCTIKKVY